jgi:virginiamycin B lyase
MRAAGLITVIAAAIGASLMIPGSARTQSVDGIRSPRAIVRGPDGALWFTQPGNSVGRITTGGVVRIFRRAGMYHPEGMAVGSDGAIWFTNLLGPTIGRITTRGALRIFRHRNVFHPEGIAAGPDGAVWFTNADGGAAIGRITRSGVMTFFTRRGMQDPEDIAPGPDGALWFTVGDRGASIGRITTAGAIRIFRHPGLSEPEGIVAGPDDALWFTNDDRSIGRITTSGEVRLWKDRRIDHPWGIAAGPDGAMWFTNAVGDSIGRITTAGRISTYTAAGVDGPQGITVGPDGALWFANHYSDSIGRITTDGRIRVFRGTGAPGASASKPGRLPAETLRGNEHRLDQYPTLSLATAEQRAAAERLLARVRTSARRWPTVGAATAAGFDTRTVPRRGGDLTVHFLHAENRRFSNDTRFLDPRRPEALIYANVPGWPLRLVGLMFAMPRRRHGPTPGGPITRWHTHTVCSVGNKRGLAPRRDGSCQAGTIAREGSEMMHIWLTGDLRSAFAIHAPGRELGYAHLLPRLYCSHRRAGH